MFILQKLRYWKLYERMTISYFSKFGNNTSSFFPLSKFKNFLRKFLKISLNITPFSDLHYFSTQQLVRVIPFKKKKKKKRPVCSCPLNETLRSVSISPRSKAKNGEGHRWSATILGEAYTLLRIVAWNPFPFDLYTVYIFISFMSYLKCLLI